MKSNNDIFKTIKYPNGDVYIGPFENGKRNGKGVLRYFSNASYEGEFSKGLFHGFGVYICKKYKYEGYYHEGKKQGEGMQENYDSNDLYRGSFKDDVYNGRGVLKRKIQSKIGKIIEVEEKIIGEWLHGKLNGNCLIDYANRDSYEGQVKFGLFHGHGTYSFAQSGSYSGQYVRGKKHGVGVRIFSDGSKYVGDFFHDCMQGDGEMSYANGDTYKGQWLNAKPHGQGEMKFSSDGSVYSGGFRNGIYFGRGTLTSADGSYYDGEFKPSDPTQPDGLKNGFGTRFWALSGNQYEGMWKNAKMQGEGVFLNASVQGRYEGFFANNQKQGYGKETWKCNIIVGKDDVLPYPLLKWAYCPTENSSQHEYCRYEGDYHNGLFHGKGENLFLH